MEAEIAVGAAIVVLVSLAASLLWRSRVVSELRRIRALVERILERLVE